MLASRRRKRGMTNRKVFQLIVFAILLLGSIANAYEPSWDGNHPESKSEAWTWMGHLQEFDGTRLGPNGVGFIYYYTRNDQGQMGSMNFRSSSLTETVNGVGQSYKTSTLYAAQYDNAELRARRGRLDLTFTAGDIADFVRAEAMSAADTKELHSTMKLFPGLAIAPGFTPKKVVFNASEEDGTEMKLRFYTIWPVLAPKDGLMRFLGQADTYSFSEPMLVTVGTYKGKRVAGLSFLDRQWAKQFFGVNIYTGLGDLVKYAHALKFSHAWSAFHVFNERTKEWSFFHLWHQWERNDNVADKLTEYSGLLYMKNGTESGVIDSSDYTWKGDGYVWAQGKEVLLDYPLGRYGFFPSRATYSSPKLGFSGQIVATPHLQNLNQPIPFYEGYASGVGTWNGDRVRIQGRLESSRLLFRTQDYKEMLKTLESTKEPEWRQPELQAWLKANQRDNPANWLGHPLAVLASMFKGLDLKLAIFGDILSDDQVEQDPRDPEVVIYR